MNFFNHGFPTTRFIHISLQPLKFIKFGLVGLFGMGIDFGFTWILKEKLAVNRFIANAIGFVGAVIFNYFMNRVWTFHSHEQNVQLQMLKFFSVSLVGLLLNSVILYFFVARRHMDFYLSKFLTICVVFLWNYFANNFFTFHN